MSLSGDHAARKSVDVRVVTHSAISNSLLCVRQEQFFSQEVLDPGQSFEGELWAEPTAQDLVAGMCRTRTIQIGRGGTRGMGLADLTINPKDAPADPIGEIRGRLQNVNQACDIPGHVVFTATLHSPCAVFDEWLFGRPQLRATDLDPKLGDYRVWASYSRTVRISGWNGQAQLPKPDIDAIAPGSCFLFGRELSKAAAPAEVERLAPILAREGTGLGEYWEEGFGEVEFCWPFHFMKKFQQGR